MFFLAYFYCPKKQQQKQQIKSDILDGGEHISCGIVVASNVVLVVFMEKKYKPTLTQAHKHTYSDQKKYAYMCYLAQYQRESTKMNLWPHGLVAYLRPAAKILKVRFFSSENIHWRALKIVPITFWYLAAGRRWTMRPEVFFLLILVDIGPKDSSVLYTAMHV